MCDSWGVVLAAADCRFSGLEGYATSHKPDVVGVLAAIWLFEAMVLQGKFVVVVEWWKGCRSCRNEW